MSWMPLLPASWWHLAAGRCRHHPGALIGALIIASLTTGLQMLNVAPAWQYVVKAVILVLAVLLDYYFKRNR